MGDMKTTTECVGRERARESEGRGEQGERDTRGKRECVAAKAGWWAPGIVDSELRRKGLDCESVSP